MRVTFEQDQKMLQDHNIYLKTKVIFLIVSQDEWIAHVARRENNIIKLLIFALTKKKGLKGNSHQ